LTAVLDSGEVSETRLQTRLRVWRNPESRDFRFGGSRSL